MDDRRPACRQAGIQNLAYYLPRERIGPPKGGLFRALGKETRRLSEARTAYYEKEDYSLIKYSFAKT